MISLPINILNVSCKTHTENVSKVVDAKVRALNLCIEFYQYQNKTAKDDFKSRIKALNCPEDIKVQSINWFLKKSTKSKDGIPGEYNNVRSLNKLENFFTVEKRLVASDYTTLKEIKKRLKYFSYERILKIISGKPSNLLFESNTYNKYFPLTSFKMINNQINRLLKYLFDYDEFSRKESIFTPFWGAYNLTSSLSANTCLYCNRNYTTTVSNDGNNYVRAELDHFFAQSSYPILGLSFYNLIPSCHICNSSLKKATNISLENYIHPYIYNFSDEDVKFTYKVSNPQAFFNDNRGLGVKLDISKTLKLKSQIINNIDLFKLDYIYDYHKDIAESLLDLQRKTVKKRITDIYNNILISTSGSRVFKSEKDVYEFAIRNSYSIVDFYKKPLAKFEKDIAVEIGLI